MGGPRVSLGGEGMMQRVRLSLGDEVGDNGDDDNSGKPNLAGGDGWTYLTQTIRVPMYKRLPISMLCIHLKTIADSIYLYCCLDDITLTLVARCADF